MMLLDWVKAGFGWSETEPLWASVLVCLLVSFCWLWRQNNVRKRNNNNGPPFAKGGLPVLGHALLYQKDPPAFLSDQERKVGPVFTINLAGRRMIVIGSDRVAMKQVATSPESVLSARQAVAEIGFEYTLGRTNVYKGTDWHKRILKDCVYRGDLTDAVLSDLTEALVKAWHEEIQRQVHDNNSNSVSGGSTKNHPNDDDTVKIPDLFIFVRRCVLRAMLGYLVDDSILQSPTADSTTTDNNDNLLDDFMEFQDELENATALAAILPSFVSVPLVLSPFKRKRKQLERKLAPRIQAVWNASSHVNGHNCKPGPWLTEFKSKGISSQEASKLVLGLMFAAHKNVAIGTSQCLCFLTTDANDKQRDEANKEAASIWQQQFEFNKSKHVSATSLLLNARTLRACVLETMRLTAHSIGAVRKAQKSFDLETESGEIYTIGRGDTVAISHINPHLQEEEWGAAATKFDLTRWNDYQASSNNLSSPVSEYKLTTFSHGVHKCPGERLALSLMELMLVMLLKHEVKLESVPKVDFERATLAQRSGPVRMIVKTKISTS